jgi:hypothetical protein
MYYFGSTNRAFASLRTSTSNFVPLNSYQISGRPFSLGRMLFSMAGFSSANWKSEKKLFIAALTFFGTSLVSISTSSSTRVPSGLISASKSLPLLALPCTS